MEEHVLVNELRRQLLAQGLEEQVDGFYYDKTKGILFIDNGYGPGDDRSKIIIDIRALMRVCK